jgi:hypothetical protein
MSQYPKIKKQSSGFDFTPTTRNDTYDSDMVGGKVITVVDHRLLTYGVSDYHLLSYNMLVLAL